MDLGLLKAIRQGNRDRIKRLAKEKPDFFMKRSPQGNTVLHISARMGKWSVVDEIFKLQPSLVDETNNKGETPVHTAAAAGKNYVFDIFIHPWKWDNLHGITKMVKTVEVLRMQDIEVHQTVDVGTTIVTIFLNYLFTIIVSANIIVDEIFKLHPSLVDETNSRGETPVHTAAAAGNNYVFDILIHPRKLDDLDGIIKIVTTVEFLRKQDNEGNTPLHIAVRNGHFEVVRNILSNESRLLQCRNEAGKSPLSITIEASLTVIAQYIYDTSPDCHVKK
ncbi:hypothetical protein QYF36_008154 [Acer negundo]|nr:hypothetical protein QYF36_008154 [Acer negundo]